jgi:ferredoxin
MRLSSRLRTLLVCSMLEFSALMGSPMRPDEIEELMRQMSQPKLAHVLRDENDSGDGDPEPRTPVECLMPKLTVEGYGTFDVADNKRLVLAIEQDANVDILHACGGNARCTTCRVEFIEGEPSRMTAAEKERLEQRELSGVRLSCQIVCDHDMSVRAISRLEGSGRPDPGRTPEETIQPPPVWT